MKLAIASDHAGYDLKKEVLAYLQESGISFVDFGCGPGESVDYVDYGAEAVRRVVSGEFDRAILFCGTGLGMAVVANKFPGIIATPCWDGFTASVSRTHNNSNCLCLGGRVLSADQAIKMVKIWLEKDFEGGRHERRVNKILALEQELHKLK
ncbi:MAG: ribose 5-phosphate isomerase B [Candidatus Saccharicenans sp.]|jgi:ribose 5-phosphate isomerase B|nr:ribose 5-phosphate isomerase B [Candidatus Saccharicenans sp.]MDH7493932.1 ribose 5-phosphate isomerase B [Candidatus Saccharicenans sp.]